MQVMVIYFRQEDVTHQESLADRMSYSGKNRCFDRNIYRFKNVSN